MNDRQLSALAALNMMIAVAAGAFGAHGLTGRLDAQMLGVWQTGVQYHLVHALGLFAVAWLRARHPRAAIVSAAGYLLLIGIVLFSGSLYLLAVTGIRWLGAITPLGGTAFLLAWGMTAWAAWHAPD